MFKPLPVLTAATLLALVVLVALGVWQLERRAEKHALIDQIADRAAAAPAPIEILLATGAYAAHRHATAQGSFEHAAEVYVYAPRSENGRTIPGFRVVTPFRLATGGTILVDRGWLPEALRSPALRQSGQVLGEVEMEGVLRPSAIPGSFTPPPDVAKRVFYARDSAAIAKALSLTLTSPLLLEATTATPQGPEPLPTTIDIPDNHLQYAITWFSLALVLLVIYLRYHQMRGLLRFRR